MTSTKFKILHNYRKGTGSSGITNDTLPLQRPSDYELSKRSYESDNNKNHGIPSANSFAAAGTASGDGFKAAGSLQIPPSAIRVQNDVCVRTHA